MTPMQKYWHAFHRVETLTHAMDAKLKQQDPLTRGPEVTPEFHAKLMALHEKYVVLQRQLATAHRTLTRRELELEFTGPWVTARRPQAALARLAARATGRPLGSLSPRRASASRLRKNAL